jgi:hypothetical protein
MIDMCVREKNCVRAQSPQLTEPIRAAVDKNLIIDHQAAVHPVERRLRVNFAACSEESDLHFIAVFYRVV